MNVPPHIVAKLRRVAFRTGGTANFTWRAMTYLQTPSDARARAEEIERAGYAAVILAPDAPLPTTFEA